MGTLSQCGTKQVMHGRCNAHIGMQYYWNHTFCCERSNQYLTRVSGSPFECRSFLSCSTNVSNVAWQAC